MRKYLTLVPAFALALAFTACSEGPGQDPISPQMDAIPGSGHMTITYTGQGFLNDGTTIFLKDQRCGVEGQGAANDGGTGLFADWNGPGEPYEEGQAYLVWVLSLNASPNAAPSLHLPDGDVQMIQVGGTWKYASQYYSYQDLVDFPVVAHFPTAGIRASTLRNVNLVVSHGCPRRPDDGGAWCSPGYWRNASEASWALTGYAKTDYFNDVVVPHFYDTASGANPTLIQVLTTPGANTFGAASDPFGLNAFNATGAALTHALPGYHFDPSKIGEEDACPVDNHGNITPGPDED